MAGALRGTRIVTRILLNLCALVAVYWIVLFLAQRAIAFPAPSIDGAPARPPDAQVVWLESLAGRTEALYLPPLGSTDQAAPLLLFAHGNAELIQHWPDAFTDPRRWGMAVLLVEYPGYGNSGGAPSSRSIQQVFEAAFDWAAGQPGIDPQRIVAYGRSLGGGAACALTTTRDPAALILESTFTNTTAFAWGMGAPPFLVRDRFDNLSAVTNFKGPRLILHGERDRIVPTRHGRRLAEAAGVPLRLMPCGHNDCPRPWADIREFLVGERIVLGAR